MSAPTETRTLEVLRQTLLTQLHEEFVIAAEVDFDMLRGFARDMITVRVVQTILGQRLDEQVVRYPSDWWQGFKQRFFPRWARRRWPIHHTVVHMRLWAMYPKMQLPAAMDAHGVLNVEIEHGD